MAEPDDHRADVVRRDLRRVERLPFQDGSIFDVGSRALIWATVTVLGLRWAAGTHLAWPVWAAAAAATVTILVLFNWSAVSPKWWFTTHKPLYEHARTIDPGPGRYGSRLPLWLGPLSADGRSSGTARGRFLPQWIDDDGAGGYIYSPHRSPAGADLYGTRCRGPVDLGDGWWTCGLPER